MGAVVIVTGFGTGVAPAVLITIVLIFARMSGPAQQIQSAAQNFFFALPSFEAIGSVEADLASTVPPARRRSRRRPARSRRDASPISTPAAAAWRKRA